MRRFITNGEGLPNWSSPISHAVVVDQICWLSGQLSIDGAGNYVAGSIREEAERALGNLLAALHAAEFAAEELVYVDVALVDLSDMAELNRWYAERFVEGRRPARTVAQVAALPFGGRIKLSGVAIKERECG